MGIRIALAGNPNCGKTTLFNALTGSNQFVGNWPGVTVEKKEGKLKKHSDVIVTDLPGIYSLSPYTPEEVVARNYLIDEKPDVILNIIDGTNLERNLYLTTQLTEIGIPVVIAINMMDVVRKNGDEIRTAELSRQLGCKVIEISALKGTSITEAADAAIDAAGHTKTVPLHSFSGAVEHTIAHIEEAVLHEMPEDHQRWYAIKIFERDSLVLEKLAIASDKLQHIEKDIQAAETELDDDAGSIITGERYVWIASIIKACYKKKTTRRFTSSDKIDRIVTNRWLGLPIFAVIMFLVYYISMVSVGQLANDWVNDGVFGDGWHLFGIGTSAYEEAAEKYGDSDAIIDAFISSYGTDDMTALIDISSEEFDETAAAGALDSLVALVPDDATVSYTLVDESTLDETVIDGADKKTLQNAVAQYKDKSYKDHYGAPDTSEYGVFIPSIPAAISSGLDAIGAADWLHALIVDGIVAGLGAVLGFTPQIFVLFLLLAFLEACGYMARIAFVLDRVFHRFGLSGKSFIPMLIGTGCGVPGIMATRTIESENDRRMTIMTTTFIPCGAKVPFIALFSGAVFGGSAWIATSAYFIGIAAIIVTGIMLKKTKMFSGDPAPFVMELPAYHLPTVRNLLRSMWERGWAFVKKEFTLILLSTIVIWFLSGYGFSNGSFGAVGSDQSLLAAVGRGIAWIFKPLGFGNWQAAVSSITGLVAKENIVATMGIFYGSQANIGLAFTQVSGLAFLVFNLLCAPCFAAMGAIAGEMKSARWTWFAIGYQCGFAYIVSLMVNQFGNLFGGNTNVIGLIAACVILAGMIWMLVRPARKAKTIK